jgi:hypothetical protein
MSVPAVADRRGYMNCRGADAGAVMRALPDASTVTTAPEQVDAVPAVPGLTSPETVSQ